MTAMALHAGPASSTSETAAVRAVQLGVTLDERPVLADIHLDIPAGQYVGILGANGAGKSTLLRILASLLAPTSGTVQLFGQDLARDRGQLRARIGLIGHQPMLYRQLSAQENLEFFGRLYGVSQPRRRAQQLLQSVGLAHRAQDQVKSFSRGMTQRLAIARALMHSPDLILADEPFGGLDVPSILALEQVLAALHQRGRTIVLVNHDIQQTLAVAQRIIVLRGGCISIDSPAEQLGVPQLVAEVSRQ
jgi:heme exporter protein A